MYVCMYVYMYVYMYDLALISLNVSELEGMEKRALMALRRSWIVTRKESSSVSNTASPADNHYHTYSTCIHTFISR